jgi:hypothetical protein
LQRTEEAPDLQGPVPAGAQLCGEEAPDQPGPVPSGAHLCGAGFPERGDSPAVPGGLAGGERGDSPAVPGGVSGGVRPNSRPETKKQKIQKNTILTIQKRLKF